MLKSRISHGLLVAWIVFLIFTPIGCTVTTGGPPSEESVSRKEKQEVDAFVADLRDKAADYNPIAFNRRIQAAGTLGIYGARGAPAIPALMDVLDDDRSDYDPHYYVPQSTGVAGLAEVALEMLIPHANGYGFDYACGEIRKYGSHSEKTFRLTKLLGAYGPRAMPILTELSSSADSNLSSASLSALDFIKHPQSPPY